MSGAAFLLAALRAIVEMLWLALLARAMLHVLAGAGREGNPLYRLFVLITRAPLALTRACLPAGTSPGWCGVLCFVLLFALWLGLAALRMRIP